MPDNQLLISVVRRSRGDDVVAIAKKAGARGSTILYGRGTANNRILQLLGLADTEKELVFTIATKSDLQKIIAALRDDPDLCKKMPGIAFVVDIESFMRSGQLNGTIQNGHAHMNTTATSHILTCVIVNTGFADDIMLEARKAGAPGGTIIKARGTGKEEDSKFFGITIVPAKEMVLLLTRRDLAPKILDAVKSCPCLEEPGVGIIFQMPVEDFFPLGRANQS